MEYYKIISDYSDKKLKDEEFSFRYKEIIEKIKTKSFMTIHTSLLNSMIDYSLEFDTLNSESILNSRYSKAEKRDCRNKMYSLLKDLIHIAQVGTKGDMLEILSCGFEVQSKSRVKRGLLPAPAFIKAKTRDIKGYAVLNWQPVDGAKCYELHYTRMPFTDSGEWNRLMVMYSRHTFNGLESGKEYAFKVAAINAHPEVIWSEITTTFIV